MFHWSHTDALLSGFIAAAHADGSLYVVDMRGPRVILRSLPEDGNHRRSFLHRHVEPFTSLTFAVAGTESGNKALYLHRILHILNRIPDPQLRVLLIAARASGQATIFTLIRTPDGIWSVSPTPETSDTVSQPFSGGSFVVDTRTGNQCRANRGGLGAALSASPEDVEKGKAVWVCAGVKGARSVVDITGERVGRVEWSSKFGKVERVSLVQKNGTYQRHFIGQ